MRPRSPRHPRPWRKGSVYGSGPVRPLDRNQRARFTFLVDAHRRAHRLPGTADRTGQALLGHLGAPGRCYPSYETLAAHANLQPSTVVEHVKRMRRLGLLEWERRLRREGGRAVQTSNAYLLLPREAEIVHRRLSGVIHSPLPTAPLLSENPCFSPPSGIATVAPLPRLATPGGAEAEQYRNAARQLRLLGCPVPAAWGIEE